jgi:dipeptidyl aminopeptidase/acylaminoacyl peptidase/uncharacterized lipoprotein NlpE involved in copper resistance
MSESPLRARSHFRRVGSALAASRRPARLAIAASIVAPVLTTLLGSPSPAGCTELLVRVTTAYPCIAADGKRIAYESNAAGDLDVYVVDLAAGTRHRLTDAPGRDGTPTWSPDGQRIAFISERDGHRQIYVMNADGSRQTNLSRNEWTEEHPFWSADGSRLLYITNRDAGPDNLDIWQMNADGSDARRVAATPRMETYASWSPDGQRIVCRRVLSSADWAVVVMDADGTHDRVVAPAPGMDAWPVWTPDGSRIVFASDRSGRSFDLWITDLAGGEPRRLTFDDSHDDRQPWVFPDGRHVAFARYQWFRDPAFYEASEILAAPIAGEASAAAAGPLGRLPATFTGELPCADCEGIASRLELHADGTFLMNMVYLGRSVEPIEDRGTWTISPAGILALQGEGGEPLHFAVAGQDSLRMTDRNGKPIASQLDYTLRRTDAPAPVAPGDGG